MLFQNEDESDDETLDFFSHCPWSYTRIALIVDVITTRQECLLNFTYVGNLRQNVVAFGVGWNQPIRNSEIETSHQNEIESFFFWIGLTTNIRTYRTLKVIIQL